MNVSTINRIRNLKHGCQAMYQNKVTTKTRFLVLSSTVVEQQLIGYIHVRDNDTSFTKQRNVTMYTPSGQRLGEVCLHDNRIQPSRLEVSGVLKHVSKSEEAAFNSYFSAKLWIADEFKNVDCNNCSRC